MSNDIEERLKAAEAAVAELSANFTEWIGEDIERARKTLEASLAEPDKAGEPMADFYDAMHNIKGLGGSFGYDLVTSVADSCCNLLKKTENRSLVVIKVCQAHMTALNTIVNDGIEGDGGEMGAALLKQLTDVVDDTLAALEQGRI